MYANTLIILVAVHIVQAIIGYDCGGAGMNVTTISAVEIAKCDTNELEPSVEEINIQLLQINEFHQIPVTQCKIEVDRTIYHCGMHSHVSPVHNGRREYLLTISYQDCNKMHSTGSLIYGLNKQLEGLKVNTTNIHSLTLAGSIGVDGTCTGTQYSDPFGTWDNVVVQASIKITLKTHIATVKLSSDTLILASGTVCQLRTGSCIDNEEGDTFWTPLPMDSCHFNDYDVLYEGIANKITSKQDDMPIMYTVTTGDTTFALSKTTETKICGYTQLRTEHPRLLVFEIRKGEGFKIRSRISVNNLDIFTYVNSKLIYVEKHIRTQMTQLYKDIMTQKCALEEQIMKNALALAIISPQEMAYALMKGPGYTAISAGEVIHIIKCIPVECQLKATTECYQELPVQIRNHTRYLQPKTRILLKSGSPRDCSILLPAIYQINGAWYKMIPRPVETFAPETMKPLTKSEWKYINPKSLATSGIYTNEDVERLKEHIMFPMEKPSVINTIARGAMGKEIPQGTISMYNLFDENSMEKLAESTGRKLWGSFMTFGSASAGVLAIFIMIRIIKNIIDIIIHGYALHSIYGWSIHLLGAIWSSVTNLLMHLAKKSERATTDVEMQITDKQKLTQQENMEASTAPHATLRRLVDQYRHDDGSSSNNQENIR